MDDNEIYYLAALTPDELALPFTDILKRDIINLSSFDMTNVDFVGFELPDDVPNAAPIVERSQQPSDDSFGEVSVQKMSDCLAGLLSGQDSDENIVARWSASSIYLPFQSYTAEDYARWKRWNDQVLVNLSTIIGPLRGIAKDAAQSGKSIYILRVRSHSRIKTIKEASVREAS